MDHCRGNDGSVIPFQDVRKGWEERLPLYFTLVQISKLMRMPARAVTTRLARVESETVYDEPNTYYRIDDRVISEIREENIPADPDLCSLESMAKIEVVTVEPKKVVIYSEDPWDLTSYIEELGHNAYIASGTDDAIDILSKDNIDAVVMDERYSRNNFCARIRGVEKTSWSARIISMGGVGEAPQYVNHIVSSPTTVEELGTVLGRVKET